VLDAKLATLGMRITWRQTWDDLVLPDDAVAEVREFIARMRHRRLVYDRWGFGRKVAKGLGLSALFAGPPGTGKTMVAGLIADALQLDLYQVDLSKVVSKWVGETEKNLGELFDAAEAGHAILLFDEADSLFAKRTQVQSSNDRYANLEVNYLLQRMEAFAGIVILTTNHDAAIDEAFRRRLSLRVDFPVPEPDERERLWRALLPAEAALGPDIDYDGARRSLRDDRRLHQERGAAGGVPGGRRGHAPIAMRHLDRAARAEYQAMGKVVAQ
jgi:SpoVK/Ycf46/Vps4 family AAA+-type ATPase